MADEPVIQALGHIASQYDEVRRRPMPDYLAHVRSGMGDFVYDSAPDFMNHWPYIPREVWSSAAHCIQKHPDLADIAHKDGEEDPFFTYQGGGGRESTNGFVIGMFSAALRRLYFEGTPLTVESLTALVLENFEELKRTARDEDVTIYAIHGFTGMILPAGSEITTPWGVLRPAPEIDYSSRPYHPTSAPTTAVLMRPIRVRYKVTREKDPGLPDAITSYYDAQRRMEKLLPLAFALGVNDGSRIAPVPTFTTNIEPFRSGSGGGLSPQPMRPLPRLERDQFRSVEQWSSRLQNDHVENLNVAAQRLVTAIVGRSDKEDSLIDAVTVWESLVGIQGETVFRVTGALAKLLRAPEDRLAFQKELKAIYEVRSGVVHGRAQSQEKITRSADEAVGVAVEALKAVYDRGSDWLAIESGVRAMRLLLTE